MIILSVGQYLNVAFGLLVSDVEVSDVHTDDQRRATKQEQVNLCDVNVLVHIYLM